MVWEVGTGECRHVLVGHNNGVAGAAFAPDGELVVSVARAHRAILAWDMRSWHPSRHAHYSRTMRAKALELARVVHRGNDSTCPSLSVAQDRE